MTEVLTAGRVSVDLYPEQIGVPLAEVLGEELEPHRAARAIRALGPAYALVKLGADGVLAANVERQTTIVPALEVEVVNGLGAGDAFGSALCHGLRSGWDLRETLHFANAAGALVATRLGCADDMPTASVVEALP